jgi:hypothetical protein
VIACFVDIGGNVDHHCLEVIVCFVDIGVIVDHLCLEVTNSDSQQFHQYQQSKQSPPNSDNQQFNQYKKQNHL